MSLTAKPVDMRKTDTPGRHGFPLRLCGVLCRHCKWRGKRSLRFRIDLGRWLDVVEATHRVKGTPSDVPCPHCGWSEVVFTHVLGRPRRALVAAVQAREGRSDEL